ncbi:MAG: transposase, partial [Chlorobiaceae bacterium]
MGYSRGMSVRDMQAMLLELYEVDVSEALISSVTDAVLDDVRAYCHVKTLVSYKNLIFSSYS